MIDYENLNTFTNKELFARILLMGYDSINNRTLEASKNYNVDILLNLGFKKKGDDLKLRSCIDLIEDTEMAIINYFKNGLGNLDLGEKYLRLYGILNAISLQIESLGALSELFKLDNNSRGYNPLKSHEVYEIRNKMASHTVSYRKGKKDNTEAYRITQNNLARSNWGQGLYMVSNLTGGKEVNLLNLIIDYNSKSDNYMQKISEKAMELFLVEKTDFLENLQNEFDFASNRTYKYD